MSRFLLAMWDGGGAVPPELGAARRLVESGHDVHVVGDPTLAAEARSVGAGFAPWVEAPHRITGDPSEDVVKDWEVGNPLTMLRRIRDRLVAGPAGAVARDTAREVEAFGPDAVLADHFLFGALIAGQAARLPVAALVPNIWSLPVRGVPPIGGGFRLARGPLGRARDAALVALTNRVFQPALPTVNDVRAEHGLAALDSFYDQVLTADRVLVLTSATFDYASPFVPPNARYVGPVLDDPGWAGAWASGDAEDGRPLVLVSLSSTFQNQADLLQRIIDALAPLPVRAVVTTGPAVDPDSLRAPDGVEVVRSAPHAAVLGRASLVVTHCGHGTALKALAAGLPLVCLPMGRDQDDTAARVVHHGAGVRLRPSASTSAVRAAVTRVLQHEHYRVAARRLAGAIAAESDASTLVTELESLLGDGNRQRP